MSPQIRQHAHSVRFVYRQQFLHDDSNCSQLREKYEGKHLGRTCISKHRNEVLERFETAGK